MPLTRPPDGQIDSTTANNSAGARLIRDVSRDVSQPDPQNALGNRFATKLPNIIAIPQASDQVALLAMALPGFTVSVQRAAPDTSGAFDSTQGLPLTPHANGNNWVGTQIAGPLAKSRLWQMLLDPHTFGS